MTRILAIVFISMCGPLATANAQIPRQDPSNALKQLLDKPAPRPLPKLERPEEPKKKRPEEFWAAIPDAAKDQTRVGRYNLKDFTFKPVLTVPQLSFDSMSMWVDESRKQIYVVYRNQLLRLPLEPRQPPREVI